VYLYGVAMSAAINPASAAQTCAALRPINKHSTIDCAPVVRHRLRPMQEKDEGKRQRLAAALGIDDSDVQSLQSLVEAGQFKLEQEAKEQESFF